MNRLGPSQRVVVVVGLGAALVLVGDFVTSGGGFTGWTAYAPLSASSFSVPGPLQTWEQLLVWLLLVAIWVAASLFLLRSRGQRNGT